MKASNALLKGGKAESSALIEDVRKLSATNIPANNSSARTVNSDKEEGKGDKQTQIKERENEELEKISEKIKTFISNSIASKNWMMSYNKIFSKDDMIKNQDYDAELMGKICESSLTIPSIAVIRGSFILNCILDSCKNAKTTGAMKALIYSIYNNVKFYGYNDTATHIVELKPTIATDSALVHWLGLCILGADAYSEIVKVEDRMAVGLVSNAKSKFTSMTGIVSTFDIE